MELELKLELLKEKIACLESAVVAFSGGVDSTFLAKVAVDVLGKDKMLAVTATSSTYAADELEQTKELAKELGFRHKLIVSEELDIDNFSANPPDRCYFCKSELFQKLWKEAREEGLKHVLDGSNLDDQGDYRPGMRAACETKVVSPLMEAGLTKAEIRELSREMGLPTWDKPAMACLSSRFPYGERITPGKLTQVEQAERYLKNKGFRQLRVRHHGETARIEVLPQDFDRIIELAAELNAFLKGWGFTYVTLDLEGYRSGSMNETLAAKGASAIE